MSETAAPQPAVCAECGILRDYHLLRRLIEVDLKPDALEGWEGRKPYTFKDMVGPTGEGTANVSWVGNPMELCIEIECDDHYVKEYTLNEELAKRRASKLLKEVVGIHEE